MKRRDFFMLLAIAILAFSWRIVFVLQLRNPNLFYLFPGSDSTHYDLWAKTVLQQGLFYKATFYGMPLYAYFLAFVYKVFLMNLWAVRIIQMAMGITNCFLVYLIAKRLFDFRVGIIAAALISGYIMLIFYEILLMPTALIIFLNSLVILSFFELNSAPLNKNFFLFGLILGVISLAEPGILLFALGIIAWPFFSINNKAKKQAVMSGSILIAGIILVLSLNVLRNYIAQKDIIIVSAHSGINFYIGNNPEASGAGDIPFFLRPSQKGHIEDAKLVAEDIVKRRLKPSEVSKFWFSKSLDFIRGQPVSYFKLLVKKFLIFWRRFEPVDTIEFTFLEGNNSLLFLLLNSFGLISPLCILGMFLCLKQFRNIFVLYIFILSQMVSLVLFFVTSRYRLAAVPFMMIFCGYCLYWFYFKFKQRKWWNFVGGFLVLLVLFGFVNYKNPNRGVPSHNQLLEKHYNLGVVNMEKGAFDEAIKELKLAIESEPLDYLSHFALANAYYSENKIELAIKEYKITLLMKPNFVDGHFNLGHLYQSSGKLAEAEKEYKEVLNLSPDSPDAYYKLASLYKSSKRYKEAMVNFKKILEYDPHYSASLKPLIEECVRLEANH